MIARLKEILDSAYSYKKALDREKLSQKQVDLLREKLKCSKIVPQSLSDKQVSRTQLLKTKVNKIIFMCENYSCCFSSMPTKMMLTKVLSFWKVTIK